MTQPARVYVFISDNHEPYGLSVVSNGSNMPTGTGVANWEKREEIPLTAAAVAKYAKDHDPQDAITNLIMRGYHITRVSAEVIPFPMPHRSSSSRASVRFFTRSISDCGELTARSIFSGAPFLDCSTRVHSLHTPRLNRSIRRGLIAFLSLRSLRRVLCLRNR